MNANTLKKLIAVMIVSIIIAIFSFSAHAAYPYARVTNKTPYPAKGQINYASYLCKNDQYTVQPGQTWTAKSRGVCLITWISAYLTGPNGATIPATTYTSTGTTYSNFIISPTQNDFRVWSDHELAAENAKSREGKSPGFYIVNKTDWPISFSLDQVGCLYYGTVPSGGVFRRNTGAVWFTIKANVQPDGKEPRTDWNCIAPVAAVVGAVAFAAITGGYGAFAALPAATAATSIGAAGLAGVATSSTVLVASGALGGATVAALTFGAKQLGALLSKNGQGELIGQYAGPEWPFRCDQMPVYHLTGGPSITIVDGNVVLGEGRPLKFYKQNGCGNSMMAGVPQDPNPNYVPYGIAVTKATPIAPAPVPAPVLPINALVGNYVHQPAPNAGYAQNDWHIGAIVQDANGLRWSNKAGSVWKLTPDLPNLKLHTGPDNPYFKTNPDIDVVVSNGQLIGLRINGAPYARTR